MSQSKEYLEFGTPYVCELQTPAKCLANTLAQISTNALIDNNRTNRSIPSVRIQDLFRLGYRLAGALVRESNGLFDYKPLMHFLNEPSLPACYLWIADGRLLYVGETGLGAHRRLLQHQADLNRRISKISRASLRFATFP